MKITNAFFEQISIDRFEVTPDQAWCIIGSNRSGIRTFFDMVCGDAHNVSADELFLPHDVGRVCFKDQQQIYEEEVKNDDTDYLDRPDPGTLARQFIQNADRHTDLIKKLGLSQCMDKGYRQLSTGQTRKLLILSKVTENPSFLAIQAPFEGLDQKSRRDISSALAYLHAQKICLLLFVHNQEDIPFWCTHLALIQNGRIAVQGTCTQVIEQVRDRLKDEAADFDVSARDVFFNASTAAESPVITQKEDFQQPLVSLNNGFAGYDGELVFNDLSLTICKKDHTLITGPNGCGKSTLLHMITGDHPSCYQNDLKIFGIQRGSGESIWDLKKHMGIVSPELHRNYYIPGPTLHCILSGLFDSIGLYQHCSEHQRKHAEYWLKALGMEEKAGVPFRDLTFADQRLVLIARALIKHPDLLILDEPTQGLDAANRKALLDFLEEMTWMTDCTILYVSHREDEFRPFFVHHLEMSLS
jgi:molybdate transport system ATP-binding protein